MFCNLIAWKEGDEYVFEDGSKAYPYPDNDKRFDKFMLIPDWVVKGLTDTPFRYFGFKSGRIHIKQLGVFTREEFEREIVKYKYKKLNKFIGKTIRLENGDKVVLESLTGVKFETNKRSKVGRKKIWLHVKDVVTKRNTIFSFGTELVANNGVPYKRIDIQSEAVKKTLDYTVLVDGEIKVIAVATLGYNLAIGLDKRDIYPIISEYMYNDRVLYFNGIRRCKVKSIASACCSDSSSVRTLIIEFLDNGETAKVSFLDIFRFVDEGWILKGRWVDVRVVDTFFDEIKRETYRTLEFCDGSRTNLSVRCIRTGKGRLCHSDVLDICRASNGVKILDYRYENGKWIVESNIGTFERGEFRKGVDDFEYFRENCVGKTLFTKNGYRYVIENTEHRGRQPYLVVRFDNGATKLCTAINAYTGNVSSYYSKGVLNYRKNGILTETFKDWSDSKIGLKFRVLTKEDRRFKVELENEDIVYATRERILGGRPVPKFITLTTNNSYIGKYESYLLVSMYFDFKKDMYVLLTKERTILLVLRNGKLKKTIKHDEE